jgi:hypothetical protein
MIDIATDEERICTFSFALPKTPILTLNEEKANTEQK